MASPRTLSLGEVHFTVADLPLVGVRRARRWQWEALARLGLPPLLQYRGEGEERVSLRIAIGPGLGRATAVEDLRALADTGIAHVLADGTGLIYGSFVLSDLREDGRVLDGAGRPRRRTVSLELRRYEAPDRSETVLDLDAPPAPFDLGAPSAASSSVAPSRLASVVGRLNEAASAVTGAGDSVDEVVRRHYGTVSAPLLQAVMESNRGLAALGPLLPSGTRITLPPLAEVQPSVSSLLSSLWR